MRVAEQHPRIWLDEKKIGWLKEKVKGKTLDEIRAMAGESVPGRALVYAITGDVPSGREAVEMALGVRGRGIRDIEAVALCYDWCHALLSEDEKAELREKLAVPAARIAAPGQTLRSFHNGMYTEGWTAGSAALAICGEHPAGKQALDFLVPEYEDALKVFRHVFYDGAWGEGYCYNHHISVKALKFFLALESATGVDMVGRSPYLENNGYYMMYGAKPNGLVYPGQDNDFSYINDRDREGLLLMVSKWGNAHYQRFLNTCPDERFAFPENQKWKDLLWYDPAVAQKPVEELPLSRIFRDEGLVFARGGWRWDNPDKRSPDAWISLKCGDYYGDHAHFDSNAFEIYYKGELAIDSGRYDDDWGLEGDAETIRRSQFFNYYQRTIAHNTILVYDPDEKMEMGVVNDGGQRGLLRVGGDHNSPKDYDQGTYRSVDGPGGRDWAGNAERWNTGDILAYTNTDLFMYVCGDATASYSPNKMKKFVRQLLFVRPNLVIVFDRVVSGKAEYKKTWLLHSVEEPKFATDMSSFEVSYQQGRLVCVPLLPAKRQIAKIGGPGDEFLVGGIHYTCGPESTGRPSALHYGEIPGAWRIEESPAEPSEEDYFLNIMLLTDAGSQQLPRAELEQDDPQAAAVRASAGTREIIVRFAKGEKPSASLEVVSGGETTFAGAMPDRIVLEKGRHEKD